MGNPKQQTIYERLLRLVGPGPAAFFRDACRIMTATPVLETTTHLVAHSLREIDLGGVESSDAVQRLSQCGLL